MYLVVGLGNPGEEYSKTRHNIGFMAADEIHSRYNFTPFKSKFEGLIAEGTIDNNKVLLLKPQTFMNLSGNSVSKVAKFYKIPVQNIVVIHDDKDLALGKLKAKNGGSAGGHNGLKNIDSHLTNQYNRIRIQKVVVDQTGSRPPNSDHDYFLCKFGFWKCFGASSLV